MNIMVWAYLDNNLGDDLMIKLLINKFPQHEFYLYSNRSIVRNTFIDDSNVIFRKPSDMKLDINTIDMYLSIGGSIFQVDTLKRQLSRISKILLLRKIKKKGNKIATIGCNLGPYNNKIGLLLTKVELKINDLVTVRDKSSFKILESFKTLENYHLADDIVYNMKNKKDVNLSRSGLGISVYRSLRSDENNYSNYMALAYISDKYIERTKKKVFLFAFDSENENDISAAHHIFNLAKNKESIEIIPYLGEHKCFINKMNECERIIAIRFHSAIISELLEIPFLPVIYSNKMESYLEDKKYSGEKIFIEDLDIDKLDIDNIVDVLIDGKRLFNSDKINVTNSSIHFEELSKLMNLN